MLKSSWVGQHSQHGRGEAWIVEVPDLLPGETVADRLEEIHDAVVDQGYEVSIFFRSRPVRAPGVN